METIYFIIGVLSTVLGYGVYILHTVKKSHTNLLNELDVHKNFLSHKYQESIQAYERANKQVGEIKRYVTDIQDKMNKDSYEQIGTVNNSLEKHIGNFNSYKETPDKLFYTADTQLKKLFEQHSELNEKLKTLSNDPNFISRYT